MPDCRIRPAALSDAPALLNILRPYVEKTAVNFEYDPPALSAFVEDMRQGMTRYPWLTAETEEGIVGYACAGAFNPRAAYQHVAEVTVYLREDCRGRGLGRQLYQALEALLLRQHVHTVYACIGVPAEDGDPWLSDASPRFHERMGYRTVGRFAGCGYKFGRWYDMVYMEKMLQPREDNPPDFRPFPALRAAELEACGVTL